MLVSEMSLQQAFAARAFEKRKMFLSPQPLKAFGKAMLSHFDEGCVYFSPNPDHMKRAHIFLIFSRIPFGIKANDIQYTRMASSTDFVRASLPALDHHMKLQLFSLFSIFAISHFQSSFL